MGRADWITHIVKGVEGGHEIVVTTREILCRSDFEVHSIAHPGVVDLFAGKCDRLTLKVHSDDGALGVCLRQQIQVQVRQQRPQKRSVRPESPTAMSPTRARSRLPSHRLWRFWITGSHYILDGGLSASLVLFPFRFTSVRFTSVQWPPVPGRWALVIPVADMAPSRR